MRQSADHLHACVAHAQCGGRAAFVANFKKCFLRQVESTKRCGPQFGDVDSDAHETFSDTSNRWAREAVVGMGVDSFWLWLAVLRISAKPLDHLDRWYENSMDGETRSRMTVLVCEKSEAIYNEFTELFRDGAPSWGPFEDVCQHPFDVSLDIAG